MAGQQVFGKFPLGQFSGVEYIGPVSGRKKLELLAGAASGLRWVLAEAVVAVAQQKPTW